MAARQLRALEQLDRHLQCVFRPESIPGWLERPIERLEGRIPRDMLTHEGVEALLRFVLEMMPAEI
jgi:uncharacterized protein (DUF2384 family)